MEQGFQHPAAYRKSFIRGAEAVLRPAAGVHVAALHTLVYIYTFRKDAPQDAVDLTSHRFFVHIGDDLKSSYTVPDLAGARMMRSTV